MPGRTEGGIEAQGTDGRTFVREYTASRTSGRRRSRSPRGLEFASEDDEFKLTFHNLTQAEFRGFPAQQPGDAPDPVLHPPPALVLHRAGDQERRVLHRRSTAATARSTCSTPSSRSTSSRASPIAASDALTDGERPLRRPGRRAAAPRPIAGEGRTTGSGSASAG